MEQSPNNCLAFPRGRGSCTIERLITTRCNTRKRANFRGEATPMSRLPSDLLGQSYSLKKSRYRNRLLASILWDHRSSRSSLFLPEMISKGHFSLDQHLVLEETHLTKSSAMVQMDTITSHTREVCQALDGIGPLTRSQSWATRCGEGLAKNVSSGDLAIFWIVF